MPKLFINRSCIHKNTFWWGLEHCAMGDPLAFSSIISKVEMEKDIHVHMWKNFAICKCENLLPFDGENSIETNLQTSYLLAGQSISYKSVKQFWLNFQIKWQKARGWLLQNSHYQTVKTIRRKIFDWSATRTTDDRWGNCLQCPAENQIPIPNF